MSLTKNSTNNKKNMQRKLHIFLFIFLLTCNMMQKVAEMLCFLFKYTYICKL